MRLVGYFFTKLITMHRFPVVSLGIFSVVLPTEPCALRSTQPLKVSTRDFSCGKGGRCVWVTTYHPCSAETWRKSGALTYPEPLGPTRPVAGDLYFYFITMHSHLNIKLAPYVYIDLAGRRERVRVQVKKITGPPARGDW